MLQTLDNLGRIIFLDDEQDFGKFSFPGHSSPLHHWQVGMAMSGGAKLLRALLEIVEAMDVIGGDSLGDVEAEIRRLLQEMP